MSDKKAPNAVVVSAQRLQDLRDLCQPSNFNTTEQAHSALHNGISKLLNEKTFIEMDVRRLLPGDKFHLKVPPEYGDEPYEVYNRITVVESKITLLDGTGQHATSSQETYIAFGPGNWHCYLKLSDLTSYFGMGENKVHMKFPERVFLATKI